MEWSALRSCRLLQNIAHGQRTTMTEATQTNTSEANGKPIEGRDLKEFFTKKGPPEPLLALSFMRQIAAALQRASELGIIHRDIKPENILLTRKGEVKVADFGLSRVLAGDQPAVNLTQSGVTMGTPLYMAPEQVEGKPVDP